MIFNLGTPLRLLALSLQPPAPHIRALTMEAATEKYELTHVGSVHSNSCGQNNSCFTSKLFV